MYSSKRVISRYKLSSEWHCLFKYDFFTAKIRSKIEVHTHRYRSISCSTPVRQQAEILFNPDQVPVDLQCFTVPVDFTDSSHLECNLNPVRYYDIYLRLLKPLIEGNISIYLYREFKKKFIVAEKVDEFYPDPSFLKMY